MTAQWGPLLRGLGLRRGMRVVLPVIIVGAAAILAGCSGSPSSYYAYNGPRPTASYSRSLGLNVPVHVASYSALPQPTYYAATGVHKHQFVRAHSPATAKVQAAPPRTDAVAVTSDQADADAPLPFTPEWWAHEKATDDKLKKTMEICRGC